MKCKNKTNHKHTSNKTLNSTRITEYFVPEFLIIVMDPSYKSDLREYISQCKARLASVLQTLGWSEAATLKDYNSNSIACSTRHVLKKPCPMPKSFPDSCVNRNSLTLGTQALQDLLENNTLKAPDNFSELQGNFSREQKLKLYEHVIENTKKLENNLIDKNAEGEISLADILAQKKREEKRKKRRFRKSKPTHIEEVRSLVDLQMQALEQFLGNKLKTVEESAVQSGSKQNDHRKEITYSEERRQFKNDGRKERHREIYTKYHEMKSSSRNLVKEALSDVRERGFENCDRIRRDRNISSSEDISPERKKHKRHKSKEKRKHSRRSRSHSNKVSKEKKYHSRRRSRSRDRKIPREVKNSQSNYVREDETCQKYSSRNKLKFFEKQENEKHNNYKHYRNQSGSPENYRKKS